MAAILLLEAVKTWLAGPRDYAAGVALYARCGTNELLKRTLNSGPTPFNIRKLAEVLEQLAATPAPDVAAAPVPGAAPVALVDDPPEVQALIAERTTGFKEGARLQSQLELMATDDERLEAAIRIREIIDRNEQIWHALEHYKATGLLPAPPAAETVVVRPMPEAPAAQLRRRNTLRTYISDGRGTPEKQAAWRAEMEALNEALGDE